MGGSKKTTAAERQAKLLEDAKGEVNRRACLHRQLHKTKFCTYFLKGACHYGPQCAFAHSCTELQAMPDLRKTRMCKAFAEGKCTDETCAFAHGEQELVSTGLFHKMSLCKWNEKGKCRNGSQCRFAHGLEELRDMKKASAFVPDVPAKTITKPIEKAEPMKVSAGTGAGLEPTATVAGLGAAAAAGSSLTPAGLPTWKWTEQGLVKRTALRATAEAWPYQASKFPADAEDPMGLITPDMFALSQALAAQALACANLQALNGSFMPKMYMGDFGNVGGYWFQPESFDEDTEAFDRMISTQTEELSSEDKFDSDYFVDTEVVSA